MVVDTVFIGLAVVYKYSDNVCRLSQIYSRMLTIVDLVRVSHAA